jgi:hypothetical protein
MIGLDLSSGRRWLKRSGELYGEISAAGAITSEMVERYSPEALDQVFNAPCQEGSVPSRSRS